MQMDFKTKVTRRMRSATSDKETLNRQILKWNKGLKEVEKILNQGIGGQRKNNEK